MRRWRRRRRRWRWSWEAALAQQPSSSGTLRRIVRFGRPAVCRQVNTHDAGNRADENERLRREDIVTERSDYLVAASLQIDMQLIPAPITRASDGRPRRAVPGCESDGGVDDRPTVEISELSGNFDADSRRGSALNPHGLRRQRRWSDQRKDECDDHESHACVPCGAAIVCRRILGTVTGFVKHKTSSPSSDGAISAAPPVRLPDVGRGLSGPRPRPAAVLLRAPSRHEKGETGKARHSSRRCWSPSRTRRRAAMTIRTSCGGRATTRSRRRSRRRPVRTTTP